MKKIGLSILVLCLSIIMACADNKTDSIRTNVAKLSQAFEGASIEQMDELLSNRFSVSLASMPRSANYYLKTILSNGGVAGLKFESVRSLGDTTLVDVTLKNNKGEWVKADMAFDRECKLLYSDYFDRLFGQSRTNKSEFVGAVPFELIDGSIVLTLKLNDVDKPLKFIFDSGADGIAFNREVGEYLGLKPSIVQEADVVGGSVQTQISGGNTIRLSDRVTLANQNIALIEGFDLGDIDGLIGINIAWDYIIRVDNEKHEISFYTVGDYAFEKEGTSVEITVPNGVILMPATINLVGKKDICGNFVIDTGAHYHLIAFERFVRKNRMLLTGFKPESQAFTMSMGVQTPVFYGKTKMFVIGDTTTLDMPIALQASSGNKANNATHIPDGSIGVDYLTQFNFTIDLLRKIVHLAPIH